MRIRTKLVLAFLVLAVLPLAAIVFVNYLSSINVFRQAVEDEVSSQAMELNDRMDEARDELGRQIRALGSMSLGSLAPGSPIPSDPELAAAYPLDQLGDLAPMVESFEVIPVPPVEAAAVTPPVAPVADIDAPSGRDLDDLTREELAESGLPESFVIYLDRLIETAKATEMDEELIEQEASIATEDFLRQLGEGIGEHAERFAAETLEVEEQLAVNELQVTELSEALQDPSLSRQQRDELNVERRRAVDSLRQAARARQRLEKEEVEALQRGWETAKGIFGRSFDWNIERDGEIVGEVRAQISPEHLLASILGHARRDQGEVPFAIGPEKTLYTMEPEDKPVLAELSLENLRVSADTPYIAFQEGWLVVATTDPESDVTLGIARPVAESLSAMRQNAVRNFGFGLGAIVIAMVGILPISRRMTHNIRQLSRSVDRLAEGQTDVAVDITSRDEIGQLAHNFNRMALDLHDQRERLIDEIRLREEQETRERLLAAENERKSRELEDARAFQLSLLPSRLPDHEDLAVAVHMATATEVGGDYYDFLLGDDGSLTVAIGDATGHGAKAGTMVTAIKSLFTAFGDELEPAAFLARASAAVKRMNLGRMGMALTLAKYDGGQLALSCAGMPPPLVWRARDGQVEEIELSGLPLGSLASSSYPQADLELSAGDVVLLMTDGFPELADPEGEPLGYPATRRHFGELASHTPKEILAGLERAADEWRGERHQLDDITFVVMQCVRA